MASNTYGEAERLGHRAVDQAERTASRLADDAHEELRALREKVESLMSERVTPAVARVAGQAEDAAMYAQDALRDRVDRLQSTVREQPLTALGAAALAGFVVALIFKR